MLGREICVGDNHCCTAAFPCDAENQGDCDDDSECRGDLICGVHNCMGDTFDKDDDCCRSTYLEGSFLKLRLGSWFMQVPRGKFVTRV